MARISHPTLTSKAVTTPSTAVQISTTQLLVEYVAFQAKKVGGDNTGNVFLGDSTLDQSVKEGIELTPGQMYEPRIQDGTKLDLKDWYLDADTAADGVVIVYVK